MVLVLASGTSVSLCTNYQDDTSCSSFINFVGTAFLGRMISTVLLTCSDVVQLMKTALKFYFMSFCLFNFSSVFQ